MTDNQTVLRHTEDSFELQTNAVRDGAARVRDLTPAQRRAVVFAQQQVLRARAAKKAKDERQAALTRMWMKEEGGDARSMAASNGAGEDSYAGTHQVSLREAIGHVLRDLRSKDHKTLREVSENAGVSLGYLSEVERGQKEASSELLSSIAEALGVSVSQMLRMVADYIESLQD
jgi:DNA-binding XRE family transcriptional regulator